MSSPAEVNGSFDVALPAQPGTFCDRDDEQPYAHTAGTEAADVCESSVSRRGLLHGLGALAGAGLLEAALPGRLAFATTTPQSRVVVLFLRGACDTLSLLAPIGDPHYASARPTLALSARRGLAISRTFAFHPDAKGLKHLYDAGHLAPVVAVAAPHPTRSHFEATERMETSSYQSSAVRTGWLDRYAEASGLRGTFSSVALGGNVPRSLTGSASELVLSSIDGYRFPSRGRETTFLQALRTLNADSSAVSRGMRTALDASATLQRLRGRALGAYPNSPLGRSLHDVATLVRARLPLQVATIDAGGWDMHVNLGAGAGVDGGWMGRQVSDLSGALAAFAADLGSEWARTTVVVMSEFGRRVAENSSKGVDHGHGSTWLVAGGRVRGGRLHGTWPTLAPSALDEGDVAGRVDHRQVLAEVLSHAGASARTVATSLPGAPAARLGLFRS